MGDNLDNFEFAQSIEQPNPIHEEKDQNKKNKKNKKKKAKAKVNETENLQSNSKHSDKDNIEQPQNKKRKRENTETQKPVTTDENKQRNTVRLSPQQIVSQGSAEQQVEYFITQLSKQNDLARELSKMDETPIVQPQHFYVVPNHERTLLSLSKFISDGVGKKKLDHRKAVAGSPTVIVICSSAVRCVDMIRSLKPLKCQVLKLFSKHIKIPEQEALLRRPHVIGVGTPNRLLKLAQQNSLNFSSTALVVYDMVPDVKEFTVFTLYDVKSDTFRLFLDFMHQHLNSLRLSYF
jgi:protein CMS1